MRSSMRRIIPWVAVLALALPACQDDIEDEDISDNLPSIIAFTPLVGNSDITDMIEEDDPTTAISELEAVFRADIVAVTIQGDKRSAATTSFASDVILTQYDVQYTPLDGAADALFPPDWTASISEEIPAGSAKTFTIEIIRLIDKVSGALTDLDCTIGVGACSLPRRASVTVTFTGADISGHPVTVTGFLTIIFADFGDEAGADTGLQ